MTWNTPGDTMQMFCWWKANSEADINNQLGQMNDFFEPHKFTECTDQVMDYKFYSTQELLGFMMINLIWKSLS